MSKLIRAYATDVRDVSSSFEGTDLGGGMAPRILQRSGHLFARLMTAVARSAELEMPAFDD